MCLFNEEKLKPVSDGFDFGCFFSFKSTVLLFYLWCDLFRKRERHRSAVRTICGSRKCWDITRTILMSTTCTQFLTYFRLIVKKNCRVFFVKKLRINVSLSIEYRKNTPDLGATLLVKWNEKNIVFNTHDSILTVFPISFYQ